MRSYAFCGDRSSSTTTKNSLTYNRVQRAWEKIDPKRPMRFFPENDTVNVGEIRGNFRPTHIRPSPPGPCTPQGKGRRSPTTSSSTSPPKIRPVLGVPASATSCSGYSFSAAIVEPAPARLMHVNRSDPSRKWQNHLRRHAPTPFLSASAYHSLKSSATTPCRRVRSHQVVTDQDRSGGVRTTAAGRRANSHPESFLTEHGQTTLLGNFLRHDRSPYGFGALPPALQYFSPGDIL